ncbi:helix-turn-helix transcriptional regulator [Sulfitobacter pacificus]|nr:helix-turn-helix transcriptional regulator [Sulfitobacter pacificus]
MTSPTFTERLRAKIDSDPNLTEAGLAKKANLDTSTIRQMLAKNRSPRMNTAEKICRALGTTVEEFMLDSDSKEERDIALLVSRLSLDLRQKLLSYGEGLLDAQDHTPEESDEEE